MKKLVLCMVYCCLMLMAGVATGEEAPGAGKVFRAAIGSDGVQRVDMVGGSYFFNPNYIIVKANVPVELVVRKEPGVVPHNIVMHVAEAGITFDVPMANEPKTIRFTPKKAGIFPFYCSKKLLAFESHREKGMEGLLEVVE